MSNTIKIRRGTEANLPTLEAGELGFTTDTHKVYVGDGTDNHLVTGITKVEDDPNPRAGGEFDFQNHSAGFTLQTYTGTGTTAIDWTKGNHIKFTFGAQNETITFTAPSKPCAGHLIIVQDSTGSRTITWNTTIKWVGQVVPTLTTTANGIDILSFLYDGTNWYGSASLDFG